MNTSLFIHQDYNLITFYPTYENVHALLADIHLYAFNQDGQLLGSQAVRREKVALTLGGAELTSAIIVIAPPFETESSETLTLSVARARPIFETTLRLDPAQLSYVLPPVPEAVWRWWLVHSLWNKVRQISKKRSSFFG